jgi:hypothetical protein
MSWLRRAASAALLAAALAALGLLAQPSPPAARANIACDLSTAPAGAVSGGIEALTGGAVGFGNPAGDVCNKVSGAITGAVTAPISGALKGVGNDIFAQLTTWVSEGASWLIGQVTSAIEKTTTPQLATKGFLSQYAKMAAIAAVMAAAMLLAAVLEGLAQGNATLLLRVALINAPLALLATTVAYAVVQLLLVATDELCAVISASSHHGSQRFFEAAITGLGHAGGAAGKQIDSGGGSEPAGGVVGQASGTVAVPLFVGFLAAIVGAFAAFFVWLELLARDAAVYVVALFLPLGLAASIWPRWSGALRRTGELLLAVIGSKFVIVAIIGLAAALVTGGGGGVEHVLAASALMLLACFAPFVLLKLIPFAEGAMGAAYSRRSASGGAISGVQLASDVQILRSMANSRQGSGVTLWGAEGGSGGVSGGSSGAGGGGAGSSGGGGAGGEAAAAGGGAAGPAAAAAIPAAAAKGARGAGQHLSGSATAQQASQGGGSAPQAGASEQTGASEAGGSPSVGERPPRPSPEPPPPKPGQGEEA